MMANIKLILGISTIIVIVAAAAVFMWKKSAAPIPSTPISEDQELFFETIDSGPGYSSAQIEEKNYVIVSLNEGRDLWEKLYSGEENKPPFPEINFEKEMVVAALKGASGGADRIIIDKIVETEKDLQVFITEEEPAPDCAVVMVVAYPYHIVKLEKINKEVVFNVEKKIVDCE